MQVKDTFFSKKHTINLSGDLIDLSIPKIMGILNITPDSFFDGGKYTSEQFIEKRVEELLSEGADIIDIGAYSSRPGAKDVCIEEEKKRLELALQIIRKKFKNVYVSVDTFRAEIAQWVVQEFGCQMINDISAGEMDSNMFATIADLKVPYIMMHMKGTPENMQNSPNYDDLIKEIVKYFAQKVDQLKQLGVNDVILDPGFGFGKTMDHNYKLLNGLSSFRMFELPLLVGISRKSMIYKFLDSNPEQALNGTSVLNTIALLNGANILRVHDVKEAAEVVKLVSKTQSS